MAYFNPCCQTKLKMDAGAQGIAATMKQYDPQAKRWRPVTYRSRALTDTEMRYSQLEKEAKAVDWGVFANQIYLYGLWDTFDISTDHNLLVPLFATHKTMAPLRIELEFICKVSTTDSIMLPARRQELRQMKRVTTPDTGPSVAQENLALTKQNGQPVMQRKYLRRTSGQ